MSCAVLGLALVVVTQTPSKSSPSANELRARAEAIEEGDRLRPASPAWMPCDRLHPSRFTWVTELDPPLDPLPLFIPEPSKSNRCFETSNPADGRAGRWVIPERSELVIRFARELVVDEHGGLSVKGKVTSRSESRQIEVPGYGEIGKAAPVVLTRTRSARIISSVRELGQVQKRLIADQLWLDMLVARPSYYRALFLDILDAQAPAQNANELATLRSLAEAGLRAVDMERVVLGDLKPPQLKTETLGEIEAARLAILSSKNKVEPQRYENLRDFERQLQDAATLLSDVFLQAVRDATDDAFPPVDGNEYWPEIRLQPKSIGARAGDVIEIEITHTPKNRSDAVQRPPRISWKLRFVVERTGFYVDTSAKLNLVWSAGFAQAETVHGAQGMLVPGVGVDFLYYASDRYGPLASVLTFIFSGAGLRVDYLDFDSSQAIELGLAVSLLAFRGMVSLGVGYNLGVQNPRWSDRALYFGVGLGVDKVLDQARTLADFFQQ